MNAFFPCYLIDVFNLNTDKQLRSQGLLACLRIFYVDRLSIELLRSPWSSPPFAGKENELL